MSVAEHHAHAATRVPCFVLTVSDTRTIERDTSGQAIVELLEDAGHVVVGRALVPDEPADVARTVRAELARGQVRAIITTGGTGLATRDSTYEALAALFDKRIDGFGELFRALSFEDIGPKAMLSRAAAGVVSGCAIFLLPGSEAAVRLAVSRLVVPVLGHLVQQISK